MKLKVDVSNSDPDKATQEYIPPSPGSYQCKIVEATVGNSKAGKQMLTICYEIVSGKQKGKKVFDRIVTSVEWKMDQLGQALGLATKKKRKFTLDTEEMIGEIVTVQVKGGEYQGNPTAEVGRVTASADEDDLDEDDLDEESEDDLDEESEDDDEDEDEEDDEDEDEEDDEDDEEDDEDDEGGDEDDYEEWSVAELRKELKDRELIARGAKPALIKRLREDDESEE